MDTTYLARRGLQFVIVLWLLVTILFVLPRLQGDPILLYEDQFDGRLKEFWKHKYELGRMRVLTNDGRLLMEGLPRRRSQLRAGLSRWCDLDGTLDVSLDIRFLADVGTVNAGRVLP